MSEKKHICPGCNKPFATSAYLSQHVKTSKSCAKLRGEKPKTFDCTFCSKPYTSNANKIKHEKTCDELAAFTIRQQEEVKVKDKEIADLKKALDLAQKQKPSPIVTRTQPNTRNVNNVTQPKVDKWVYDPNNWEDIHERAYSAAWQNILSYDRSYIPPKVPEVYDFMTMRQILIDMEWHLRDLSRNPRKASSFKKLSKEEIAEATFSFSGKHEEVTLPEIEEDESEDEKSYEPEKEVITPLSSSSTSVKKGIRRKSPIITDHEGCYDNSDDLDEEISQKSTKKKKEPVKQTVKEIVAEEYFDLVSEIIRSKDRDYRYNKNPTLAQMRKLIPKMQNILDPSSESESQSVVEDENEDDEKESSEEESQSDENESDEESDGVEDPKK